MKIPTLRHNHRRTMRRKHAKVDWRNRSILNIKVLIIDVLLLSLNPSVLVISRFNWQRKPSRWCSRSYPRKPNLYRRVLPQRIHIVNGRHLVRGLIILKNSKVTPIVCPIFLSGLIIGQSSEVAIALVI